MNFPRVKTISKEEKVTLPKMIPSPSPCVNNWHILTVSV